MPATISPADLIINNDGSIYHLNLLPEDIAPTIITVGDPERVSEVSKHFDKIELKKGKREFVTHTGYIGNKRITVLSTGIGTDNIDIVLNELDALANIDFTTRLVKETLTSLQIVRIGTSGAIQPNLAMGTILASSHAIGLDALMHYYQQTSSVDNELAQAINNHFSNWQLKPYLAVANKNLLEKIGKEMEVGITATAPGFYAPQGRQVRAITKCQDLIGTLNSFNHQGKRITNLEMETAGIYALANALGHQAVSVNAILASRTALTFSPSPEKVIAAAIKLTLENILSD